MESLHVKFERDEALAGKKEFLYSQIALLELLKKLKDYRNSRKQELILKYRLRRELNSAKTKIVEIGEHLPKETEEDIRMSRKSKIKEHEERKGIEAQLQEIREKLAGLENG